MGFFYEYGHIKVCCNISCINLLPMLTYYYDKDAYDGWFFNLDEAFSQKDLESDSRYISATHRVFYNFEHLMRHNLDYSLWFRNFMDAAGYDEWWDYNIENVKYVEAAWDRKVKFVPPRWYPIEPYKTPDDALFDYLFYGVLSYDRCEWLDRLDKSRIYGRREVSMCILDGVWNETVLRSNIDLSKMVLVLHQSRVEDVQEEARIVSLVCGDKAVLAEKSTINYFPGCIAEVGIDDVYRLDDISVPSGVSSTYRDMTESDESYSSYKDGILAAFECNRDALLCKCNLRKDTRRF